MTREELMEKSLESLRVIAKAQGVKSITKYRKAELADIIMNGGEETPKKRGRPPLASKRESAPAAETAQIKQETAEAITAEPEPAAPDMPPQSEAPRLRQSIPEQRGGYTLGYSARPQQQNNYRQQQGYRNPRQNQRSGGYQQGYGYQQDGYRQSRQDGYYQQGDMYPQQDYRIGSGQNPQQAQYASGGYQQGYQQY